MTRPMSHIRSARLLLAMAACLALVAVAAGQLAGAQGETPNGAGLVVRHGDGSLVYAYVEFEGETITGEELLLQSGLNFVVTPYGGLGTGICAINGEGCPADDCYCESYDSPAVYWQYYGWSGDGWSVQIQGPTSRRLADGDIDGWSWTAGDHGLPPVTIDEIAAITGFDRSPDPTATPPPPPTPTPAPPATSTPPPAPTSTSTPVPEVQPTDPPAPPATPTAAPTATDPPATTTPTVVLSPTLSPTSIAPATATVSSTATPAPAATETPSPTAMPEASPTAGSGAVIVRPGETPSPVEAAGPSDEGEGQQNLLLFGGFAALISCAGAFVLLRRRRFRE